MGISSQPWVYVISWRDEAPTKVGSSVNPKARTATLRAAFQTPPLTVQRQWHCGRYASTVEKILHAKLEPASIGGEWYGLPHPVLIEFAEEILAGLPLDLMEALFDARGWGFQRYQPEVRRITSSIDRVWKKASPIARPHPGELARLCAEVARMKEKV